MQDLKQIDSGSDCGKALKKIEQAAYLAVKPLGFRKHGHILHRFVSGDISQVIHFQRGQSYRGEAHLLFVNIGIRVPECVNRCFSGDENPKKYYPEYACNLRSRLGAVEAGEESCYDLRDSAEDITEDILRQLSDIVLPVFEDLSSREAILARRRVYPQFDRMQDHLILLEEAMIYGRRGDREKAEEAFRQYYRLCGSGKTAQKDPAAIRNHLRYLDALAAQLGIRIL